MYYLILLFPLVCCQILQSSASPMGSQVFHRSNQSITPITLYVTTATPYDTIRVHYHDGTKEYEANAVLTTHGTSTHATVSLQRTIPSPLHITRITFYESSTPKIKHTNPNRIMCHHRSAQLDCECEHGKVLYVVNHAAIVVEEHNQISVIEKPNGSSFKKQTRTSPLSAYKQLPVVEHNGINSYDDFGDPRTYLPGEDILQHTARRASSVDLLWQD